VVAVGVIAAIQSIAPDTDHQNANITSILVGMLGTLYIVVQFHRFAARRRHRLVVPMVCLAVVASLGAAFEFDGFSGELWPLFKFRFAEKRALPIIALAPDAVSQSPGSLDTSVAAAPSLGFLGSDRTGVIEPRQFSVPTGSAPIQMLWDQPIGKGWGAFAVVEDKAVTLEQRDDLECVTCYRLGDGQLLWIHSHKARHENSLGGVGPRSTPTIDAGRVYAQGATGQLWCLDLESGELIWSVDLIQQVGRPDWDVLASETLITWGRAGSPLLVNAWADEPDAPADGGRRLCVCPYGGPEEIAEPGRGLIALDAQTGDVVWTAGDDQISYASPTLMTLAGVRQIVSVNEKTVTGHSVAEGTILWSTDWPGNSNGDANCSSAIPAGENRFLVGKGYGGGSALIEVRAESENLVAEPVWQSSRVLKTKFTHACVYDNVAYALSNGALEAVEIETAERLWLQPRASRYQQGQILRVGDVIVVQAEMGELALVAVDPTEFRELLRISAMSSKTWNLPTVAGRHLLVRNDRQALCFLLPP
jgi:outer membrane protein assembly factor BamB